MTSPLQQKIKITGPSVVTANRTADGVVIWRTGQNGWSTDIADSAIVRTAIAQPRAEGDAVIASAKRLRPWAGLVAQFVAR